MLRTWRPEISPTAAWRSTIALLFLSLACAAQTAQLPVAPSQGQTGSTAANSSIVVPAGTQVTLALTSPIMARTAQAGESVYAQTAFPVTVNNRMAIPTGTYVLGQIDQMKLPGFFSPHAQFQIHFTRIIFAGGYTVLLPQPPEGTDGQSPAQAVSGATAPGDDVIPAVAVPYVEVSSANDVLLDNGSQIDMVLQVPLRLNADKVAIAVSQPSPARLPQFKPATMCRPSPGTPGTVIPGTPGTPSTTIPGGPGMPDTVIPGTPGTPDTVIPGTPGVWCPGPPVVEKAKIQDYKQSFQIATAVQLSGKQLAPGTYQLAWGGAGPVVQVDVLQQGQTLMQVPARVVLLNAKSPAGGQEIRSDPVGRPSLRSLRFAGQTFALYFLTG